MDLLKQEKRRLVYLLLAIAGVFTVAWLTSCRNPKELAIGTQASDSTHTTTTITTRDTVVVVASDSARVVRIVRDLVALRELMEELRKGGAVASGSRNARVSLRVSGDTLYAEAACDSVELKLNDAVTLIHTLTDRLRKQETTVLLAEQRATDADKVPGWMRGGTWLAVAIGTLVLIIKLAFKFL